MIQGKINIRIDQIREEYIKKAVNHFAETGERCVAEARSNGNYKNQTGNLRNSVGYRVILNGIVQKEANINSLNKKITDEISLKYPTGLVLIVVAGMNYASYVEAKNYNVLSSAELMAEQILNQIFR
ncbi:hypothetical protein ACILPE_06110 [Capnocytophaga canimorsus]|uniref:hypothetical protein n=1 Tax=Capnocytophaga canimorsus TaxID=28188 RepID=UPI0037CE764B